jgi:type I restriction enzyme R subunit
LPDFRGASRHHFIATTVDLLTTGVDVPGVRNIVFFKYVRSPISFYQMIGRGTRIDAPSGKLMFTIYDYTGATELFGEAFITRSASDGKGKGGDSPEYHPIVVEGFEVQIADGGRFVVIQEGGQAKPIPLEEYKSRLARRLVAEAPTLEEFRQRWIQPRERQQLLDRLVQSGCSPGVLQMLTEMNDYDLYDVLADLGFSLSPLTRQERVSAFIYKHEDWLQGLPPQTAAAIRAIVAQFERGGTEGLENKKLFQTPEIKAAGGLKALRVGGEPKELLQETKERMFAA